MKPNIRGYTRSKMRPGLSGWISEESPSSRICIEYRNPFRSNWLHRVGSQTDGQLVLARSGFVYLIRLNAQKPKQRATPIKLVPLLVIASLIAAMSLNSFWTNRPKAVVENSTQQQLALGPSTSPCNSEEVPELILIENILNKKYSPYQVLEQTQISEMGGIRGSRLTLQCDGKEVSLLLSMVKVKSDWKLKKVARLDN